MTDEDRANRFCDLFDRIQRPLHRYICTLIAHDADAADVLQETNLALWQQFDRFEPGTDFFAWAREIARRRVLKLYRLNKNRAVQLDLNILQLIASRLPLSSPEESASRDAALQRCLQKLSVGDRELVRARYFSAAGLAETAASVQRTPNALSQSLRRIRTQLKACMERSIEQS